jgi:hypothetical protein
LRMMPKLALKGDAHAEAAEWDGHISLHRHPGNLLAGVSYAITWRQGRGQPMRPSLEDKRR